MRHAALQTLVETQKRTSRLHTQRVHAPPTPQQGSTTTAMAMTVRTIVSSAPACRPRGGTQRHNAGSNTGATAAAGGATVQGASCRLERMAACADPLLRWSAVSESTVSGRGPLCGVPWHHRQSGVLLPRRADSVRRRSTSQWSAVNRGQLQ